MTETWKIVPSAPNYEASTLGRVRRARPGKRTRAGKIIRPKVEKNGGYLRLCLYHDGVRRIASVARLVCETFNGPQLPHSEECAHRDGDPRNNIPSNLYWATKSENRQDSRRHGTMAVGERSPRARLSETQVRHILASPETNVALAATYSVTASAISSIRTGRSWRHMS